MLQKKLSQIEQNRAASQPLPKGSAPYTCSDFFKVQKPSTQPSAKNFEHRFSTATQNLLLSPLKAASRAPKHPDLISLGTARPSPQYFPWESMELECPDSTKPGVQSPLGTGLMMNCVRGEEDYDLEVALNYGYSTGSPQLLRYVTEHTEMIHDPPYNDWECCVTTGTTNAMEIAFRIFCNPGDTVLMEGYVYPGTLAAVRAQALKIQSLDLDDQGLSATDLDYKLTNWDPARGRKPFVLYMIPTGQNPTGKTQSLERRKDIYRIAEKHDLYILEDDPYYFIHLGAGASNSQATEAPTSDLDEYLSRLPTSYLSLDVSGRVLRMDSTSKILAPGLRVGWVTGSLPVVAKFIAFAEVGALAPSGPSQVMTYKLLDKSWGHEGLIRWLMTLSAQYRRRRDILVSACRKYLPTDLCAWRIPELGMFMWFELDLSKFGLSAPKANKEAPWKAYLEVEAEIFSRAQENGVLVSSGSWFMDDVKDMRGISFRMTYAAAQGDSLERAVERFGRALRSQVEKTQQNSQKFSQDSVISKTEVLTGTKPIKA